MNDSPVALLRNGKEHSKVIPSALYEPIRGDGLGGNYIVVITEPVTARTGEAHALKFSSGRTVPADIISCHVGVEGWELAVRIRLEENGEPAAEN